MKHWLGSVVVAAVVVVAVMGSSAAYAQPVVSVQPQDFGAVRAADTATPNTITRTFNITNSGDMPLIIDDVDVSGMHAGDFTITAEPANGATIAPGATAPITVVFNPSAAGARATTLRVTSNAPNANAALSGTGTSAVIAVTDVDFGIVAPGSNLTRTTTISNSATTNPGPLHVASAALTGGNGWFEFVTTGQSPCSSPTAACTLDFTIPPNKTLEVRCRPPTGATGSQTATVTFTSDSDAGGDSVAQLTCNSGASDPDIDLVTTSIAFGDVPVAATPPSITFTIGNTGTGPLVFAASTGLPVYSLSCTASCTVAPNSMAQFTITFDPTAPGAANTDITITSNDPDEDSVTIPVTGRGTAPQISAPPTLAFGNVEVNKMSGAQELTITNTGTATLVISNASLTAGASDYIVMSGPIGAQMTPVPPMGTFTWSLVCRPIAQGARPGTFRLLSNAFMQSPVDVTLTCTGQRGVLAVSPTSLGFGSVEIGANAIRTFMLTNTGNLPVTNIAATVNPADTGYSIDPNGAPVPTSLNPGDSVTLTARFEPQETTDGGPATITFAGDWGTTPTQTTAVLSLTGTPLSTGYELSTPMLDFGSLRFDATLERTFCITNTGQAPVQIVSPLDITPAAGTVTGEFTVTRIRKPTTCGGTSTTNLTLPQTLNTGQLLEVTVRVDPANRAGMMQATLTVNSNLTKNPQRTLPLRATSTTGAFTLSPSPMIDFGTVDVQGAAVSQTVTITNTGDAPLDLTSFQRTPDPEFTITLPGNTVLQPTQMVAIPITYKPVVASAAGSEETVTLTHAIAGDVDGPASQTIAIRGRGIDRVLSLSPTPAFPPTFRNPGDDAPVRPVTVRNLGEATLKISAVMIGDLSGAWQLLDAAPVDLPKDGARDFLVRFSPMAAGLSQAQLVIMNDDSDRPMATVDLVGMGISRNVQLGPTAIRLGYTGVGVPVTIEDALVVASTDPTHTFRIRAIELDQDSPFQVSGLTPDLELAPMAERRFGISFTPLEEGAFTAKARLFLDADPLVHQEIAIEGTAVFVDAHGGGGCAAGGSRGAAGGAVLALAALLGLRRRRPGARGARRAVVAAAAVALAPGAAAADDIVLSVFDPVPATVSNGFQLQSPEVGKSGQWVASAVLSHATDPLILGGSLQGAFLNDYAVVSRSTAANVGAAVAFLGRLEAGARIPLYIQDGQPPGDPQTQFTSRPAEGNARGDLALHAKLQLTRKRLEGDGAFVAGLAGQVTLPTATQGQFTGLEDPSGRVLLLGSLMPGAFERRVTLTMNVGAVLRAPATYANLEQKSGVAWGLGLQIRALDPLWLAGEVYGDTVPAGRAERTDAMGPSRVLSPIEWLGGLRWKPDHRFTVGLAAGRGLTSAVGTPAFRGVLSLTITPGAPELRPIRVPRPDGDADADGVRDSVDRCADQPEDKDLFDDTDGCPDDDNDSDRIADAQDRCPLEAEDKDGFDDADGCIDKDNDNDGIADTRDKCPDKSEDKDGFSDTDGCPDEDNDRDGIPDAADKCFATPETINGNQDDDGCPDKGDSLVVLNPDRLEMLEAVQFTANHKVAKASHNLLGQVGATLRARSEIARLRITVHVQPSNDPDRDQEISDQRAAAVREWLVQWGVESARLEMRGFGGNKPLVPPDRKGAATLNQRIELIILARK